MDELNTTPHVAWWTLVLWNGQTRVWWLRHRVTRLLGLHFCPSCSGYFREECMTLPDTCSACYARDYGVPVPAAEPAS